MAGNYGGVATSARTRGIGVQSPTTIEHFVKTTTEKFSHVWLDLTCTEMPAELLWDVLNVLHASKGRDSVYVTLSKRGRTLETQILISTAICNALKFKISHAEDYTGAAKATDKSQKRNMIFMAFEDTSKAGRPSQNESFDENFNGVGGLVFVPTSTKREVDTMTWRSRGGRYDVQTAFVKAYSASPPTFTCCFFNTKGVLKTQTEAIACNNVTKTSVWLPRHIIHKP